jgi:hypothetical protein
MSFFDLNRKENTKPESGKNNNQVWGAILEGGNRRYTYLREIFSAMGDFQKQYNLLITDIEACPRNDDVYNRLNNSERRVWISGRNLTRILDEDDFQWIWAVISGFKPDVEEKEVLNYSRPYADGYEGFWQPKLSMQHPLADFELVPWDSGLLLFFTKDYMLYLEFMRQFPDAKDLQKYNARTDDSYEYEKWLVSHFSAISDGRRS